MFELALYYGIVSIVTVVVLPFLVVYMLSKWVINSI
jgi:hypothetical protein